jgi:hypothetical protein
MGGQTRYPTPSAVPFSTVADKILRTIPVSRLFRVRILRIKKHENNKTDYSGPDHDVDHLFVSNGRKPDYYNDTMIPTSFEFLWINIPMHRRIKCSRPYVRTAEVQEGE